MRGFLFCFVLFCFVFNRRDEEQARGEMGREVTVVEQSPVNPHKTT